MVWGVILARPTVNGRRVPIKKSNASQMHAGKNAPETLTKSSIYKKEDHSGAGGGGCLEEKTVHVIAASLSVVAGK